MALIVSERILSQLSEAVAAHLGLHFSGARLADLDRALVKAAGELGFEDPGSYTRWLMAPLFQRSRIEAMARFLTVGETHFFRDEKLFAVLEEPVLPELIATRRSDGQRRIRIWSAGCATGEEPYSIAILLSKLIPDLKAWDITILATDINDDFLARARTGVYSQWSFRSVPPGIVERYFVTEADTFVILPEIKRMVNFAYLNLVKDPYPSAAGSTEGMDIIFCRNVLMYFSVEWQGRVVEQLSESLLDGGWLVVNPGEAFTVETPHLTPANYLGVVLFRKGTDCSEPPSPTRFTFEVPFLEPSAPDALQNARSSTAATSSPPIDRTPMVCLEPFRASQPDTCVDENSYQDAVRMYADGLYLRASEKLMSALDQGRLNQSECSAAMALVSKAYANVGKLEEALAWSEKTLAVEKLNPDYHYFHGTVLQELGRIEDAINAMTRAVFLDPNLVVAHFALGHLLRSLGKPKDSERHFKTALDILDAFAEEDAVPASEGLTAGRLREIILGLTRKEGLNGRQ